MPFGSVKYTERMKPWSTTSVTSHPAALRRSRSAQQRLLVGQVERQVVELDRPRVGHAGRLGERLDLDVGVLEEGDGRLLAEGEEVVAERRRADRGDELGAEHAVVEAHGRVHVRR